MSPMFPMDGAACYIAPGQVVAGRYRAQRLIGRGGTGFIYAAEDLHARRAVAIKALDPVLVNQRSAVARYQREAKAAGGIGHPNICGVFDSGYLDDGAPFLIMELLTGRTLSERIRTEGALPFADVVSTMAQILSALAAAHAKRIIHRDIKPDNIFLTNRIQGVEAVKILDFGIAKSLDHSAEMSLTRSGMVVGTPFYMAPEQARGEILDHRVDIYSAGVILYEMLTGHRPFHASNYNALMMQVLTTDPHDPRELRPEIPRAFVDVVEIAMAKNPGSRFSSAEEFLAEVWKLHAVVSPVPGPEEIARIANALRAAAHADNDLFDDSIASDPSIPVFQDPGSFTGSHPGVEGPGPPPFSDVDQGAHGEGAAPDQVPFTTSAESDDDATRRGPRPPILSAIGRSKLIPVDVYDEDTTRRGRLPNTVRPAGNDEDRVQGGSLHSEEVDIPLRPALPSIDEEGSDTATRPFVRGDRNDSERPSLAAAEPQDAPEDATEVMYDPLSSSKGGESPRLARRRPSVRAPEVDDEVTRVDPPAFPDAAPGDSMRPPPPPPRRSMKKD